MHPSQEKLTEQTLGHGRVFLMGDAQVHQLNQFIMKTIKAKKAIDVGVFTGLSTLAAALVLPDDGKILACDVSEEFTSIGTRRSLWKH